MTAVNSDNPELAPFNPVPFWCPRFWHGMSSWDWGRLIAERKYRIDRWPTATSVSLSSGFPTFWNSVQRVLYHKKAINAPMVEDPIFVIGHWRSGTTFMQDLITQDDRFVCPTTYECFVPKAFMISESWFKPLTASLLPERRPMDNMKMGWEVPMEDEFALLVMGLPTTYRRIAFPNETPLHMDYLNLEGIPKSELDSWKKGLRTFISYLNYWHKKQLLFKSPPHTGRIKVLLEMYPRAKFVHITRNPLKFIPSTIHMWAALDHSNALQNPHNRNLRDFVFDSFERLYRGFYRDEPLLHSGNFVEVRFDEVVSNVVGTMRKVYDQLDLGGFDAFARPGLEKKAEKSRKYKKNNHALSASLQDETLQRCRRYMDKFGYSRELAAA